MSKKEKDDDGNKPDQKPMIQDKDASVDFPVLVESLDGDIYHKTGEQFHVGEKKAKQLEAVGRVRIVGMLLLFMLASFGLRAQTSVLADMYNGTNTFSQALLQVATAKIDTVTNTGTGVLYTKSRLMGPGTVSVQVTVTKASGTVGGTITLQGSLDGLTFKAIPTRETQTSVTTITAADASATYLWRLPDSPFLWYAVSWTGTGTMVATFKAIIMKH